MSSLLYNIKQGFLQIFRNRGMSLASIFSILAMLLILGLFFVITVNINLFTEVVKQDYDQVEQRYFGDFQPCTATLSWLDCVPGDQLAGTNLPDRLAECWQAFSIAADA